MYLFINLMHLLCISSKSNVTSNQFGGSIAKDYVAGCSPSPLYNTPNRTPPLLPLCHLYSLGSLASCWV